MTDRVREILSWYASDDPGTKADLYLMLNLDSPAFRTRRPGPEQAFRK